MSEPLLPPPPRSLESKDRRALLFGHPVTLLGAIALGLANAIVWLLTASYGITSSSVRPLFWPQEQVTGQVVTSGLVAIISGETVPQTVASFTYRGQIHQVVSFGEQLTASLKVTIIVPKGRPEQARISGLQKFPLRLRSLASIAAVLLLPGLLFTLWGLLAGWRKVRLVEHGHQVVAHRIRHWKLFRPFAELYLDSYRWRSQDGQERLFWSVGSETSEPAAALVSPRGGALLSHLLPHHQAGTLPLQGVTQSRLISGWAVLLLWLAQIAVWTLFFMT